MGFAVVADEIRKLAENAAVQSKTIGQTIKGIRGVIDAVVSSSGQSASTFEEILEQIRILSRLEEEVKYSMQEHVITSYSIHYTKLYEGAVIDARKGTGGRSG